MDLNMDGLKPYCWPSLIILDFRPCSTKQETQIHPKLAPSLRVPQNLLLERRCVALRGFSLRGFWDVRDFLFCGGKKRSETPSCDGEKGLRLPRSSCSDLGNEGVSDLFFPSQEGVSDPFSHRKRENPVHPKIPLANIPLAQRMKKAALEKVAPCHSSPSSSSSYWSMREKRNPSFYGQ